MDSLFTFLNPTFGELIPSKPVVKFKKTHVDAVVPEYKTAGAAGMDLSAIIHEGIRLLFPHKPYRVPTGLNVEIPEGYEGQVRPRSGLALKKGITVLNSPGTIDSDYRGSLDVILINNGESPQEIVHLERIAQLVIAPVAKAAIVAVDELSSTDRGEKGFGSTGK
jgi:dUTP pyrophosphatase